jgi:hypothetical protein
MNCDFSNRVQTDGDTAVEFEACVYFTDNEGNKRSLTAYYYQEQEDLDEFEELDALDWEIEGYESLPVTSRNKGIRTLVTENQKKDY